ncbi:MAG: hypothetical protein JXA57_15845 [Armatimonadetes bacterium]|nr:hypothetical protein [Armatimonadota bacterium]
MKAGLPDTLEDLEHSGLKAIRVDHAHAILRREMGDQAPSRATLFRALKDGTFWTPRLTVGRSVYVPVAPFVAGLKGQLQAS